MTATKEIEQKNIDFISIKKVTFALSIALVLGSLALLFTRGLNFGIDFTGGIVIEIRTEQPTDLNKIRGMFDATTYGEVTLQHIETDNDVMIRLQEKDGVDRAVTIENAKKLLGENIQGAIDFRKVDYVGPQVGEELIESGAVSLLLAFAAIMAYIWLRFEWQFSVGAIVALFHDVTITLGLYSALQLEFNLTSVAAILIIIGYSINDSVVIFDRIRDNLRKYKKKSMDKLLNESINANLTRTLLTSGTTLLSLIALVTLGGEVLYGFSLAVLCGIVIGTYSSIYIASPLLTTFNLRKNAIITDTE